MDYPERGQLQFQFKAVCLVSSKSMATMGLHEHIVMTLIFYQSYYSAAFSTRDHEYCRGKLAMSCLDYLPCCAESAQDTLLCLAVFYHEL